MLNRKKMDSDMHNFLRNRNLGIWIPKKLKKADKSKYTADVYNVFYVVYDRNDVMVKQWFVCSWCGFVIHCDLQSGNYRLRRHKCYKKWKEEQETVEQCDENCDDEENVDEVERSQHDEDPIDEDEYSSDEKGNIYLKNVIRIDTESNESEKDNEDESCYDNIFDEREKQHQQEQHQQQQQHHQQQQQQQQNVDELVMTPGMRHILAYAFERFGKVRVDRLTMNDLKPIIPHDWKMESWKAFDVKVTQIAAIRVAEQHAAEKNAAELEDGNSSRIVDNLTEQHNQSSIPSTSRSLSTSFSRLNCRSRNRSRSASPSDRESICSHQQSISSPDEPPPKKKTKTSNVSVGSSCRPEKSAEDKKKAKTMKTKAAKKEYTNGIAVGPLSSKPKELRMQFAAKRKYYVEQSDRVLRKR